MLEVESLHKRYGAVEIVRGVSFAVRAGECFGLPGPNGAGKTTTLRCCLGLTQLDAGHIVVFGRYLGLSKRHCEARVPQLLEFAGLSEKADAKIEVLSGGMKRRLTLARALINDPQVLFLDEPTTGLDPQARHLVWDRLKTLLNEGRTIILTTHFMDEAQWLCNRVAIMDKGGLMTEGSPQELIEREIEPVVVEVYGDRLMDWYERIGKQLATRAELAGDTAFCYCEDAEPLLRAISQESGLRALRRAANLEDVFLKLTGAICAIDSHMSTTTATAAPIASSRAPAPSLRFLHVVRRNYLVWRKLIGSALVGHLADPLIWLVGLGYGLGSLVPNISGLSYLLLQFVHDADDAGLRCVLSTAAVAAHAAQVIGQLLPLAHATALSRGLVAGAPLDHIALHVVVIALHGVVGAMVAVRLVTRRLAR